MVAHMGYGRICLPVHPVTEEKDGCLAAEPPRIANLTTPDPPDVTSRRRGVNCGSDLNYVWSMSRCSEEVLAMTTFVPGCPRGV